MAIESFGMKMANGTALEQANIEKMAGDPSSFTHFRLWENTTEKLVKYARPDGVGGYEVVAFSSASDLNTAITDLDTALRAEITNSVNNLGAAFEYKGLINGGVDEANALDLTTVVDATVGAGDYYRVDTSGYVKASAAAQPVYVNQGDGVLMNTTATETDAQFDVIDNTNATVQGTANEIDVTGSADTGFTVALSQTVRDTLTSLQSQIDAINTELTATQTGAGLATDGTHVARTGTNYLDGSTSLADESTKLDAAVKTVEDSVTSLSQAVAGRAASYDSRVANGGAGPASTHTLTHNWGTDLVIVQPWIVRADGTLNNDMGNVKQALDMNSVTLDLNGQVKDVVITAQRCN